MFAKSTPEFSSSVGKTETGMGKPVLLIHWWQVHPSLLLPAHHTHPPPRIACQPATHLALVLLQHKKRPAVVWAVVNVTTSLNRRRQRADMGHEQPVVEVQPRLRGILARVE
ncbi:hypothetical protein BD779DRAFT_1477448 [Infundibulicybe gibba]|nr:hypothetical protein BD779DRAFT_1477448 [Infundibulicybe gibba]